MKDVSFVLVGNEPFYGGDLCCGFCSFVLICLSACLPVASPGGHDFAAYCIRLASGSGYFVFPCYS